MHELCVPEGTHDVCKLMGRMMCVWPDGTHDVCKLMGRMMHGVCVCVSGSGQGVGQSEQPHHPPHGAEGDAALHPPHAQNCHQPPVQ